METFLIVDDKAENLYLLQSLLKIKGYHSISAFNGKEALEIARKNPPDIIISDILMPVMDGYLFCSECKKDNMLKNIPFIFYTATYTDPKDKEFAFSLGASGFILKPQEPEVFLEEVNKVIGEVKKCTFVVTNNEEFSGNTILKSYNEALVRKLEDKMLEAERATKLLESRNGLLSALINSARDTKIFSLDQNYCYTAFNEAHRLEMKKVWNAEIKSGMNILDKITQPEIRELAKTSIDRSLNGESFIEIQHQPDLDIYYELSWNPIYHIKDIIGVTVFIRDITERMHSEEWLRKSEEKYRYMFCNNPQPMWIYDLESFAFLEVNNAAMQHYGYSKEEFLNMTLMEIRPEEDITLLMQDLIKQHTNLSRSGIWRHRKKSGEIFFVEITSHQITFNNRAARHVLINDITEKIQAETSLKFSEEKYRTIFENVQDVFYQVNLEGTILDISPSVKHISDYDRYELIGRTITDLYYEPIERTELLKNIIEKGELEDYEVRIKDKNGNIKFVSINARLIFDSNGKPNHIDGAIRDISKRKIAEQRLSESEEKMRLIVEGTPYLFFYIQDTKGKITYISQSVEKITGHTVEEWQNQTNWFITKNKINLFAKERTKAHLQGEFTSGSIYLEIEHKDERPILLEVFENPIIINGEIQGLQGVAHDISERKRFENELKKLSRALEQSPVSVLITNMDGEIEYVNKKLCEMTGFEKEEIVGKNPRIFKSGEHSKAFYQEMWKNMLSGKEWSGEILNKKRNGALFWEAIQISPLLNSEGSISHFIAIKEDISEKKKMLQELIEAKEKAEEISRLKSNLMANMSHELRTPLIGILGISEYMLDVLKDDLQESAKIIHTSGLRLLKTVSEVLDLSKLESENIRVNYSIFNLQKLLIEEIALYQQTALNKNISLKWQFDTNELLINSDERLIREIVDNLLNNAIKFTKEGSVTLVLEQNENGVVIKCSDTGIGIPNDKLDYIFEEFRQISEGRGRSYEGTGLGLTIVKKFVELLNGNVSVKSELGIGTTFILNFPNSGISDDINLEQAKKIEMSPGYSDIEKNKATILLVEDEPMNLQIIEAMLSKNYNVISVSSGQKAIEEVNKKSFDIILMDINLKNEMNGIMAVQIIREIKGYEKTPIAAMTAYAANKDRDEFLASGCTHYIAKPFSKKEILKLMLEMAK